jgi:hypothetical protein
MAASLARLGKSNKYLKRLGATNQNGPIIIGESSTTTLIQRDVLTKKEL